jgi:hypothetical protein
MDDPNPAPPPKGQHDYSRLRLTRHALERFVERFWTDGAPEADAPEVEAALRSCLARTKRLGKNRQNQAVAALALAGGRRMVAIVQGNACLTVMTWPQFEPRLAEFGRGRLPRKRGRMLRRLAGPRSAGGAARAPLPARDRWR